MKGQESVLPQLFNSPIEVGVRGLLLLAELYPTNLDLDEMSYLDYVLTYSGDFDGPPSLHPSVPNRLAELSVRREKLAMGLKLLVGRGLICPVLTRDGNYYGISDRGAQLLGCLSTKYHKKLWERASWVNKNIEILKARKNQIYRMGLR